MKRSTNPNSEVAGTVIGVIDRLLTPTWWDYALIAGIVLGLIGGGFWLGAWLF